MLERSALVMAMLGVAGCSGNLFVGRQTTGGPPTGDPGASSGGSGPSTGGSGISGGSGSSGGNDTGNDIGVSAGSGTSSGAGNGTGTGGDISGDVFGPIDGGYVFCELPADAGGQRWMCPPSTYICDPTHPGKCFQCLSDGDCKNPYAPTYDHRRLKCDLSSGVPGYQNFCQGCLASSDCTTNPNDTVCDLNRADREPPVVDFGFETCACLPDGGQRCPPVVLCDPATCPLSAACTNDLQCGNGKPYCVDGGCAQCRTNADCAHLKGYGYCESNNYCGDALKQCTSDADCAGIVFAQACLDFDGLFACGCGSDQDCVGDPNGPRCDQRVTSSSYGNCGCQSATDCAPGQTCPGVTTLSAISACSDFCDNDTAKCPSGYFCDPTSVCRARCDPGQACTPQEPVCDVDDLGTRNFNGVTWCYACLAAADCDAGQACSQTQTCGPCNAAAPCSYGETCASDLACHAICADGICPTGQICDVLDLLGAGPLCYQCLSAGDCPGDQGCDAKTHTCGTCESPPDGYLDCRPGDDCSNYWPDPEVKTTSQGVCLHRCDLSPCPDDKPSCRLVPSVSADHKYCVGCMQDSDCADAGPGAWCDVTIDFTFQCRPGDLRAKPPP